MRLSPRGLTAALALLTLARCGCDEEPGLVQLAPQIKLMPESLDFGQVPLGATKRVKAAIFNPGSAELHIAEITADAPAAFQVAAMRVPAGASVVVDLSFAPNALGEWNGRLSIHSDAKDDPDASLALSGTGTQGSLSLAPQHIDFENTLVGAVRNIEVNLFNNGAADSAGQIVSEGFSRPEHYSLASLARFDEPGGFQVAAHGALTLALEYRPFLAGPDSGRVVFEICGPRCGLEVDVSASAVDAGVRLEPAALDFGEVGLGQESAQQLQVQNVAGRPVAVTAVAVSGPGFSVSPSRGLPAAIEAGSPLGVTVGFRPLAVGDAVGDVLVTTDDPALPQLHARLLGEGTGPLFQVVPEQISFGVVRNAGTYRRPALLVNAGNGDAVVRTLTVSGASQFLLGQATPGLPIRLARGESAQVELLFAPSVIGEYLGTLTVGVDGGSDIQVPLSGGMSDRICEIEFVPERIEFGVTVVGVHKRQSATLRNVGSDNCELVSAAFRPPLDPVFSMVGSFAPITLTPGQSTSYGFEYAPTDAREAKAIWTFTTTDPVFPARNLTLHGRSDSRGRCLEVLPDHVDLGAVQVGMRRTAAVAIRNIGSMNCAVTHSALLPGAHRELSVGQVGPQVLQPRDSLPVLVDFHPSSSTVAAGVLAIDTTDPDAPRFEIPISAFSLSPQICVDPVLLDYGQVQGSSTKSFRIEACGTAPVTLTGLPFTTRDAEFALLAPPVLPKMMLPGAVEVVSVSYTPTDQISDTAVITVQSDDQVAPAIDVTLVGGPNIVPAAAGRFLYYWHIDSSGDIERIPLQGAAMPQVFWGRGNGKPCTGCHSLSPDGRYVTLVELDQFFTFRVVDTRNNSTVFIPNLISVPMFSSWNPDVNAGPGYEFVYSDGADLHLASVNGGEIGPLNGASDPLVSEMHPSWGPNGRIVFVLARGGAGVTSVGPSDLMEIGESGGLAVRVRGASMDSSAHYYPRYSPSGDFIAYTESRSAQGFISAPDAQIRLVRTDGSGTVLLLGHANDAAYSSSYPTWSIDGRYLSFASNRPGGAGAFDLYISTIDPVSGDDGPAVPVPGVNTPAFEHAAQWSP